jgi:Ca-activated chloride channel family protein
VIVSGSENEGLEPIIQHFAKEHRVGIEMRYKGSVDTMLMLQEGKAINADAVWPANSLWITLGDVLKAVKHEKSILRSPVVFGVKRSVAQQLGWIGKDIRIADVLEAARAGKLRFAMTSATQSNSGASAYFGFLYAMAGSPPILRQDHLEDKSVQDKVGQLLKLVNRSSGSSGWLKEMVVRKYDEFDAMVNYEAMIIEANQMLVANGQEPMIAVYPLDGIMMADSPLGFIDKGDVRKEQLFNQLQEYLLSDPVQDEILKMGRRTGLVGLNKSAVDAHVFNPEWGIDVDRVISPVPTPSENVIRMALDLYQGGGLRKPSFTAYVLDFSGSMKGQGEQDLKSAMHLLLDPVESKRFLLQPSSRDRHIVIPFDSAPRTVIAVTGNSPADLKSLMQQIHGMQAEGGTDIYEGVARAYQALREVGDLDGFFPSIILMTDGKSKGGLPVVKNARAGLEQVPVFCISFGDADESQLVPMSELTGGRVFHGKKDLASAFRNAKGYN